MGQVEYGSTIWSQQFTFTTLPFLFNIKQRNFVPTHLFFFPGVFYSGSTPLNTLVGYRIYAFENNSPDGILATYRQPPVQQMVALSPTISPIMYLPFNLPLSLLIEFYGGTMPGTVTGDFCIRSMKQK